MEEEKHKTKRWKEKDPIKKEKEKDSKKQCAMRSLEQLSNHLLGICCDQQRLAPTRTSERALPVPLNFRLISPPSVTPAMAWLSRYSYTQFPLFRLEGTIGLMMLGGARTDLPGCASFELRS